MQLTRSQIETYWKIRLDGQKLRWTSPKISVRCPLHDDRTASATVFLDGNGGFNCHGCGRHGNLFQFECLLSNSDLATARGEIARLTGAPDEESDGWRVTACYDYRDANDSVLYQKRRLEHPVEGKSFRVYHPKGKGWEIGIDRRNERTERVLYNLANLITANVALIAEGEKDCETLEKLNLYAEQPNWRVAAT